jgi:hypothetical protein
MIVLGSWFLYINSEVGTCWMDYIIFDIIGLADNKKMG